MVGTGRQTVDGAGESARVCKAHGAGDLLTAMDARQVSCLSVLASCILIQKCLQ